MTILLTNDDGIDAPGLSALGHAIQTPTLVVAPRDPMSECSHRVTTQHPIEFVRRSDRHVAVAGTPADCVRVALKQLVPATSPVAWVISGINNGGNLGADVYISGTVAAAREAAFHGIPSIAFSHYRKGKAAASEPDWPRATRWAARVFEMLRHRPLDVGSFWNVNFPSLSPAEPEPEIQFTERSRDPLPVKYRQEGDLLYYAGNYHQRTYEPGTDIEACFSGHIAVSLLSI